MEHYHFGVLHKLAFKTYMEVGNIAPRVVEAVIARDKLPESMLFNTRYNASQTHVHQSAMENRQVQLEHLI